MPPPGDFPRITTTQVFDHLAQGLDAGVTVVTPNRRLAAALERDFDAFQAGRGHSSWEAADVLSFAAFVQRGHEDALYSGEAADLPLLLAPAQEHALWEGIVRSSAAGTDLLATADAARLAREAWQLRHAWRLSPRLRDFPLNEDARAQAVWARRYERITLQARQTDGARLPDLAASLFAAGRARAPRVLIRYGFDFLTPQQARLFDVLAQTGCTVMSSGPLARRGAVSRIPCRDRRDEIIRAATWARSQLEAGCPSIGVVVPDIEARRTEVVRIFSAVMAPDYALPGTLERVLPFNISLGAGLPSYPLVHAALLVLELCGRGMRFEQLSTLIRSPFLAGAEAEMAGRARLDAQLRRRAEPVVNLDGLLVLIRRAGQHGAACPVLLQRLVALAAFRRQHLSAAQAPSGLAKRLSEALAVVGFPGERARDSAEFQTLTKWHEAVAALAGLDCVQPRMRYAEALSRLRRIAADMAFQPESPQVPVQVLGMLEAAGVTFDRVWVMGLSDETWPPPPRPNPFLPVEVQRAAGLPQGSAAASLEFARRLTTGLLASADQLVLSHPLREDDRELKPSPLIGMIAVQTPECMAQPDYRDLIHAAGDFEHIDDRRAPPVATSSGVGGGTAMVKDQAACPFRAFAVHRLGAASLETPHPGLDAMERGTLVHRVLAQVWAQLKTRNALDEIGGIELDALLERAAQDAVARLRHLRPEPLIGPFAEIEQRRLMRLARAWLEGEKQRGAFSVAAVEQTRVVTIGGLAFNARLDRVDELPDGRRIVIDYKTRAPSAAAMLGERPDEPQLPLYLVATEPHAAAVAFAQVRSGEMKFSALARDGDLLPGIRAFAESRLRDHHDSWQEVVTAWQTDLTRIAAEFAAGEAAVDPKRHPHTCLYCDVKPFCRIHERVDAPESEDEA